MDMSMNGLDLEQGSRVARIAIVPLESGAVMVNRLVGAESMPPRQATVLSASELAAALARP